MARFDVDQTTFRSRRNRENNYLLDRRVQRTESFTGIDGVNVQDRAVQESMGSIVDRSREHLGPADRAVIQARRLLLQAIKTVEAGGTPPGVEPTYYTLRPAEAVLPRDTDWRTLLAPRRRGRSATAGLGSSGGRLPSPNPPARDDAGECRSVDAAPGGRFRSDLALPYGLPRNGHCIVSEIHLVAESHAPSDAVTGNGVNASLKTGSRCACSAAPGCCVIAEGQLRACGYRDRPRSPPL